MCRMKVATKLSNNKFLSFYVSMIFIFLITTNNEFFYRYSKEEGFKWHTFRVIILHMFFVLTELTVRAYMWLRTLLCCNLTYTKFMLFLRNRSGRLFSLTSALVPTCPEEWSKLT